MPVLNLGRSQQVIDQRLTNVIARILSYTIPMGGVAGAAGLKTMFFPHKGLTWEPTAVALALGIPGLAHLASKYPGGVPYLITKNLQGNQLATSPLSPSMMMGKISSLATLHALIYVNNITS